MYTVYHNMCTLYITRFVYCISQYMYTVYYNTYTLYITTHILCILQHLYSIYYNTCTLYITTHVPYILQHMCTVYYNTYTLDITIHAQCILWHMYTVCYNTSTLYLTTNIYCRLSQTQGDLSGIFMSISNKAFTMSNPTLLDWIYIWNTTAGESRKTGIKYISCFGEVFWEADNLRRAAPPLRRYFVRIVWLKTWPYFWHID